jgi:hypothetical protein
MNGYAAVDLDDGATNDNPPNLILIVVNGTLLIHIGSAPIFLGLARWWSAIAPPRLFTVVPSRWTVVAIGVGAILIPVPALPCMLVVPIVVLVSVLVFVLVPVIGHQRWSAQS